MNRAAFFALVLACSTTAATAQESSPEAIARRALQRRAVEATIWGMPAVNFDRMLQAATANGAEPNQVVYWSRPVNAKNQTLTPNPDTIYLNPFYDTREGPVVLEIPAVDGDGVIVGTVDDAWQTALEDVGPAGVDGGKGGKYLITPPGYAQKPPDGYIVLPSTTYRGFVILRSNFKSRSDADVAAAVAYGKRVRFYPLGGRPDSTVYVDVYDKAFDATIPYDWRFFESLDRFVQAEPWLPRDKAMIDVLRTIGIEKGKPFAPDEETKRSLEEALRETRAFVAMRYEAAFGEPFFAGTRWAVPVPSETIEGQSTGYAAPDSYAIDGRAIMYSIAYFSPKHLGAGQFYVLAIGDRTGAALDGSHTYRLTVPAGAPVKQYWSATAYDRETHALIRGASHASRASNAADVQKNADGSVDVYFGPKAPPGKESNWVPTNGRDFEVLFRFYGPEKALFEKTWKLHDIEKIGS